MSLKWIYRITIGIIIAALLYIIFPNTKASPRPELWDIQLKNNTLSILGLNIRHSNLQDMISATHVFPELAVFTKRQLKNQPEPSMSLEAYFEDVFDEGDRIIVGLDADLDLLQRIKKQAYKPQLFPNNTIRINVDKALIPDIQKLPIKSITLIAGESIRFNDFEARFGKPSQMVADKGGNGHFLYPQLGLDYIQPSDGLHILQFVEPVHFQDTLLQPLQQALHFNKKSP